MKSCCKRTTTTAKQGRSSAPPEMVGEERKKVNWKEGYESCFCGLAALLLRSCPGLVSSGRRRRRLCTRAVRTTVGGSQPREEALDRAGP